MGKIGRPEAPVKDYYSALSNIPEERRCHPETVLLEGHGFVAF
jgi:hypothetical protein